MFFSKPQEAKHYERDSQTGIIRGAEAFELGEGQHAILFAHGWTSSPRDLKFLAEKLSTRFYCKGILLEGHGTRVEDLENTHWQSHLNQLQEAFSECSTKYQTVSVVGLSYGGLLALHLAARRKVHRLVLLSPFLQSSQKILRVKHDSDLIPILPKFIQSLKKSGEGPINNATALKEHISYHRMPVKPLKSLMDCVENVWDLLPHIPAPTLIIHSTQDKTASFEGSVAVLRGLGSLEKSLQALSRSNHIITLDEDRDLVENEVLDWFARQIP